MTKSQKAKRMELMMELAEKRRIGNGRCIKKPSPDIHHTGRKEKQNVPKTGKSSTIKRNLRKQY
ncbi:hypothetical protein ACFL0Z_02310 [Patescibacteria group bacterium]